MRRGDSDVGVVGVSVVKVMAIKRIFGDKIDYRLDGLDCANFEDLY